MSNKKILIVTYYWPPNGGSGVQRWLKFVKYLPQLGWKPVVYTPDNSSFAVSDKSLMKDIPDAAQVIRFPIWEPHMIFQKLSRALGKKEMQQSDILSAGKKSLFQKFSTWIRGNFFIPDARIFWIRPSVNFLSDFIKVNEIETIVTTGPPHSLHLIGLKLKKKFPHIHWVVDLRDPWSEWDMLDSLLTGDFAKRYHRHLERKVLKAADTVITISPFYVKRFETLGGRKVELITNGFDEDDFKNIIRTKTERFTIRHVGNIDELRDPRPVMNALRSLCLSDAEFAKSVLVEFVGSVNSSFKNDIKNDAVLSAITAFTDHLPHAQLVSLYGSTDLQLLVLAHMALAEGNIPGKVFEYLASGNPVIAVGDPNGDVAAILYDAGAGRVFGRTDTDAMQEFVLDHFNRWRNGTQVKSRAGQEYSRKNLTAKLSALLH